MPAPSHTEGGQGNSWPDTPECWVAGTGLWLDVRAQTGLSFLLWSKLGGGGKRSADQVGQRLLQAPAVPLPFLAIKPILLQVAKLD